MDREVIEMDRRQVLKAGAMLAGASALGTFACPVQAASSSVTAGLRGSIPASEFDLLPDSSADQSAVFTKMLERASGGVPVFLPPGAYVLSDIALPRRVNLVGVAGLTRIVFGGGQRCLHGRDGDDIRLSGIVIDGGGKPLSGEGTGLLDLRGIRQIALDDVTVTGSGNNGMSFEGCGGRVERCTILEASQAGIYSVQASGMRIAGNVVRDCGNGGILIHRWETGEDGTIVGGNRVERILATNGGTGQFGNGINIYQAGNVIVSHNRIADCAFTAVRANSASDIQVTSNNCVRSGETGIYAEFAFEGAVIADNVVDGAANGISIVNFDKGGRMATCTGNIVRNLFTTGPYEADPPGFGVGINVEADTTVTGNLVENAPTFGMAIGWGPYMRNVVASSNVIRRTGTGIAVSVVEGSGSAVISGNIIREAPGGAIVGYRWAEPATGDLALGGGEIPPNLTISGNQAG